ncbi:Hsp20/alpha crystallin family protein [Haloglomus halophilum]|jgi:HSP20 family protein|uniref:Hsp20/alpha crystallin family protein n=1 Tax=Haloglomus halophilum TaxID=2962672 RepID=UPI0020C9AEBD|nr:Hsp20/alpha crystallin family protein [Haloglomus halophilum]
MRRDDRDDDPFSDVSDFFREIERMMGGADSGFGDDVHFRVDREDDLVRVVGDLPGVEKEAIDVQCDGHDLIVGADTDRHEYRERIDLPVRVDEHSAAATFNNGVLEITLDPVESGTGIDLD